MKALKVEPAKAQLWLAIFLTSGEWALAIYFLFSHGDIVMIYLAATYLVRETKGGQHYHEIIWCALTEKWRNRHSA